MTTITASVQANPQVSALAKSWNRNVGQTIATGSPLCLDVANLIAQYLPPVDGWITEWTGERGREIVAHAITQAETLLTHGPVNLITQYCQKSDVFGLEQLEKAAGIGEREKGSEELIRLLGGRYNPEQPLPLEIDDEMQKNLGEIFSQKALGEIPGMTKVTELYSLYWCPKGMTANNAQEVSKKYGKKFHEDSWKQVLDEHGDAATTTDSWIQFPNKVLGRSQSVLAQEALIPAGFEFPHFSDTVFCVFMRYVSVGQSIMSDYPWNYTRCQEETRGYKVIVGAYAAGDLDVNHSSEYGNIAGDGVAIVRKFC